jgi:hypothetical protein
MPFFWEKRVGEKGRTRRMEDKKRSFVSSKVVLVSSKD